MRFDVRALVKLTSCARSNFILHAIRIVTTYNVLNYICECEFHYFLRISRKKKEKIIFRNYYYYYCFQQLLSFRLIAENLLSKRRCM